MPKLRSPIVLLLLLLFPLAADAQAEKTVPTNAPTPATKEVVQPAPTPVAVPAKPAPVPAPAPGVKQPTTGGEAIDATGDFIGALKAKRWWFAAAGGIFLLLFLGGLFGLWAKIGTTWAWVTVGVLSLAAGIFAAFDATGFNWGSLFTYMSAGPTIAWLRDFVKDAVLKLPSKAG